MHDDIIHAAAHRFCLRNPYFELPKVPESSDEYEEEGVDHRPQMVLM
jgi:hypothetical protein